MRHLCVKAMLVVMLLVFTPIAASAQGRGFGHGRMDATHQADMKIIHALLQHRNSIDRKVENLPNGVRTITESDDPQVASWLHVAFVAICAILVVGGLVKGLFYVVDVIEATRPK